MLMRLLIAVLLLASSAVFAEKAPPIKASYTADQVADGVYVIHGPLEYPTPENQGFMNNPAFVVTGQGVVVIDPGSSVQVGEMVLDHVRTVTDKPVLAVFNTHVHADHWLGNQAIAEAYPNVTIYAHPKMIEAVEAGAGLTWVENFERITEGAIKGTRVVNANKPTNDGDLISIGGQDYKIMHTGKGHTVNDLMIYMPYKNLIFLGDNCTSGRIIRMDDGNFQGNVEALDASLTMGARIFVPGHGQTGDQTVVTEYRDYLQAVYNGVKKYFEDDLSDFEIKPKLEPELARWKNWSGFQDELGKHISLAYLEIEAAEF